MVITTKAQRKALKKVYDRVPIFRRRSDDKPISYREFRSGVEPTFGMDGAVTIHWCGMWLAIEANGYTHS